MRHLSKLSSLLGLVLLLLAACGSSKGALQRQVELTSLAVDPFIPINTTEPLLYEVEVKFLGQSMTGLLYIQKPTWDRVDVAMLSHFGLGVFEATLTPLHYTFHSFLPLLDQSQFRELIAQYLSLFSGVTIPPLQMVSITTQKGGESTYYLHATQSPIQLTIDPQTRKIRELKARQVTISQELGGSLGSHIITIKSRSPFVPTLLLTPSHLAPHP